MTSERLKLRRGRRGMEYEPVTVDQILCLLRNEPGLHAEQIGEALWPHLHGRGPARGGPSSCAVAAAFALHKLLHAKKVRLDWRTGGRKRWYAVDTETAQAAAMEGKQ